MKYKVIVYYDNMPDSEHIFSNKNDAINELHLARTMDDVKECYFSDKEKALERMEILKDLSMAVDDATVWMEEISDDE